VFIARQTMKHMTENVLHVNRYFQDVILVVLKEAIHGVVVVIRDTR